MTRIRKAYGYIWDDGDFNSQGVIHAPSVESARSQLFYIVSDSWSISFRQFLKLKVPFTRLPSHDVELPERHAMASEISAKDLHIVTHAYGGTSTKAGHRDYFFTAADNPQLTRLTALGLFKRGPALDSEMYEQGSAYFILTDLGKAVAAGEQALYEPDIEIRHAARLARKAARRAEGRSA